MGRTSSSVAGFVRYIRSVGIAASSLQPRGVRHENMRSCGRFVEQPSPYWRGMGGGLLVWACSQWLNSSHSFLPSPPPKKKRKKKKQLVAPIDLILCAPQTHRRKISTKRDPRANRRRSCCKCGLPSPACCRAARMSDICRPEPPEGRAHADSEGSE